MAGKLLVLCGIDGSGKTTQEQHIQSILSAENIDHITTKQPTDWYRNLEEIRSFLDSGISSLDINSIALLAAADRMQHINRVISPNIKNGTWVICNRYLYSTYAYFYARNADMNFVKEINRKVPKPDLGILFQIDPWIAIKRIKARDKDKVKFEEKDPIYLSEVQNELLKVWPPDFLVVNGSQRKDAVTQEVRAYLQNAINEYKGRKAGE